jgi:hypothetical protein
MRSLRLAIAWMSPGRRAERCPAQILAVSEHAKLAIIAPPP